MTPLQIPATLSAGLAMVAWGVVFLTMSVIALEAWASFWRRR